MTNPMAKMTCLEREAVRKKAGKICCVDNCKRGAYIVSTNLCNFHSFRKKKYKQFDVRTRFDKNEIKQVGEKSYIYLYDNNGVKKAETIIDTNKVGIVSRYKWCLTGSGYVQTTLKNRGKTLKLHRLLVGAEGGIIDHKNKNRLDNRMANIRIANSRQNMLNKSSKSKTGKKGVYKSMSIKNPYIVRIWDGSNNINIGLFNDLELAHHIYKDVFKQLFKKDFEFL